MSVMLADVTGTETVLPGDLVGLTSSGRPVFLIGGGAPDDDSDDDNEDDSDDDGDSEDDDEEDDEKEVTIKAGEKKKLLATNTARKQENRELKRQLAEVKAQLEKKPKKGDDDSGELDEEKATALRDEGAKGRDDFWKPLYVKSAAVAALVKAGYNGNNPNRLAKLIDISEIEVDEDGEIDGLDDQIAELKQEYKDLFARKSPGRSDSGERSGEDKDGGKGGLSETSRKQLESIGRVRRTRNR